MKQLRFIILMGSLLSGVCLTACAPSIKPTLVTSTINAPSVPTPVAVTEFKTAASVLFDVQGNRIGTATFMDTTGGLKTILRITNLKAGKYFTAIHAGKTCALGNGLPFGAAANPIERSTTRGLSVAQDGSAIISILNPTLKAVDGENALVGHTILIKTERERIACGEIMSEFK